MDSAHRWLLLAGLLLLASILASKLTSRIGAPMLLVFLGLGMLVGEEGLGGIAFGTRYRDTGWGAGLTVLTAMAFFGSVSFMGILSVFKQVQELTRTREGDVEHIKLVISNPRPTKDVKDDGRPGIQLTANLPGPVKEANRGAEVQGNRVTWHISLYEFLRVASTEVTVTYAVSGTEGAAGAPKGEAAPGAEPARKEPSEKKSGD